MTDTTDIARVAATLTKAQREAVLSLTCRPRWLKEGEDREAFYSLFYIPKPPGLAVGGPASVDVGPAPVNSALTALGEEVRAYLENGNAG